jgi:hypothetical protein
MIGKKKDCKHVRGKSRRIHNTLILIHMQRAILLDVLNISVVRLQKGTLRSPYVRDGHQWAPMAWSQDVNAWACVVNRGFRTFVNCILRTASELFSISARAYVSVGLHADSDVLNHGAFISKTMLRRFLTMLYRALKHGMTICKMQSDVFFEV